MGKIFRYATLLWVILLVCAVSASAVPVRDDPTEPSGAERNTGTDNPLSVPQIPLTLCLVYFDSQGQFLSLEATPDVTLNPETGEAILPIRETPARAVTIKVFLFDGQFHILAPVTAGSYAEGDAVLWQTDSGNPS